MSNHEIFVLIGPQGICKTTIFRHILHTWQEAKAM